MSTCISSHGEFGSHIPDELHGCTRCGVLDEDALRAELERLQVVVERLSSDYEARGTRIDSLKREVTQVSLVARRTMDENDKLKAENDRLNSWAGLMSVLDKHYPQDIVDGSSTDPGARHVVLVRKLDQLGIELAEERRTGANAVGMLAEATKEIGRLLPVVEAVGKWRHTKDLDRLDAVEDVIAAYDTLGTDAATPDPLRCNADNEHDPHQWAFAEGGGTYQCPGVPGVAGTGEPPCDMDTSRGICGRPAEVRHCHGDEHGYCCVEGTYLPQPDGVAVHRMDLSRAERRSVAWRVRARYANAETQTFDHEAHALAMNELDRLKAERPGSPFDAEPAASPVGSSTAGEGDGRG